MKQKKHTLTHRTEYTKSYTIHGMKVLKKLQNEKKTIEQYQTALCETREVSAELPIERFLV